MAVFSERLRGLREQKGFSQRELANELGVSNSSIGMYESGKRKPDPEMLEAIADYFNVDIDYLVGRSDVTLRYTDILAENHYQQQYPSTIAAHLEQDGFTQDEIDDIENYMEFVKARRKQ